MTATLPRPELIRNAALEYAQQGKPVFPCGLDKKPLTSNGFKDATTDPEQIKAWWAEHPGAAIGMPTGEASKVWILDVDPPDGPESLARLERENSPLPETLKMRTGRGGDQYFFKWTGQHIPNSVGKIGANIDVRGDGGYTILPPSRNENGPYEWTRKGKAVPAPQWLVDLVTAPSKVKKTKTAKTNPRPCENTAYGQSAMEREIGKVTVADEGQRNHALNSAAFSLFQLVAGGELDAATVEAALLQAALRSGLPEREAKRTIQSGREAGLQEPRTAPYFNGNAGHAGHAGQSKGNNEGDPASNAGNAGQPGSECNSDPATNAGHAGLSGSDQEKCNPLPQAPLHCFHPDVAHLIKEVATAKSAPVETAIAALLAVVAAMIGRVMGLRIKEGWIEYANLYLALIALSGSGKSPVTSFFFRLIRKLERQFQKRFEEALEAYEEKLSQWAKESKRKDAAPGPKPSKPRREDILVDDWTVESLTDTLAANPFGILAFRDELAGLLLEMDKYSNGPGGGTKNRLMSAYDSGPWKTSRINQSRVSYVPNACISLYGTIQPVQAKEIFTGKDKATGFLSRFLMINAAVKNPSYFNNKSESLEAIYTIERLVNGLYQIRNRKED